MPRFMIFDLFHTLVHGQLRGGSKIVDIGEPPGMPRSNFYDMERSEVRGYWNYV
jgi:hypothetical protein